MYMILCDADIGFLLPVDSTHCNRLVQGEPSIDDFGVLRRITWSIELIQARTIRVNRMVTENKAR